MGFKLDGFDEFEKKLNQMAETAKEYEDGKSVDFNQLFNQGFMVEYTDFKSIDEFFEKSPFTVNTQEDLEQLDESQLDGWVKEITRFSTWEEMLGKAGTEHLAKELGFK
ncbi:hypothetical protein AWM68_19790 [Fictibacillus phosphorivorans]|uniref:Uncharacterized protein n=1 Tax=Fictibacillus phosphorivorans TaxID=1221500 RepID=A0A163RKR4_9BACL|nr:hypothetical protein [Fictibacillus phosphorivorans]KZE67035.1 hypothetical protein AWM68_19790 [Fictibacillus phosphorivorans]